MKKYLTILSLLITSLSYSQIKVIKVQGQVGISKADSINGYVTPAQLRTKVDTSHKDITNVFAPLYSVNVNDSTHELHAYLDTTSTLSNNSDSIPPSVGAVRRYVSTHSGGGSTDTTSLSNRINSKVDKTTTVNGHPLSSNVTVSKSDVGLGNVDNTSDISKPISTAVQNALNLKVNYTDTATIVAHYLRTSDALGMFLPINNPTYTGLMTGNGATQTGSGATGAVAFNQTWNSTALPTLITGNATILSGSGVLINLLVNGVSKFRVTAAGNVFMTNDAFGTAYTGKVITSQGGIGGNGSSFISNMSYTNVTNNSTSYGFKNTDGFADTSSTPGSTNYTGFAYLGVINQVPGRTGITRGFYSAPFFSLVPYNWRSFESNNTFGYGFFQGGGANNYFSGNTGFGDSVSRARVDISAGTSTIPSLIIRTGVRLTTPYSGAIENDGNHLYWTDNSLSSYQLDQQSIDTVSTISSLSSYSRPSKVVYLNDTLQGGLFFWTNTPQTINIGTIFAATGKGSGYWVRIYDKSKGVNVDWFGSRDDFATNKAIAVAGVNGVVNFTPNKVYTQHNRILPMYGQLFNGYGATLKRGNDSVVTTTTISNIADSFIVVNAVPSFWNHGGGYIHIFTDTTDFSGSANITISSISGDTVRFIRAIGGLYTPDATHTQITQWAAGSKVHFEYTQIDDNGSLVNYSVKGLTFDGNRANNNANHSWRINTTLLLRGNGGQPNIERCSFINIPNENIMGHGFKIVNNYGHDLNGSFVHLSGTYGAIPAQIPSIIEGNITDSTNQIPDAVGNHSEGAITFSNTSGYVSIANNRFKNGNDAVFGAIRNGTGTDGGTRKLEIKGNTAENFNKIFYNTNIVDPTGSPYKQGHIFIDGNTFDNCGINDWTAFQSNIDKSDTITVGENSLVGGTVWNIPVQNSDSLQRYVLNNGTSTPQRAAINITGQLQVHTTTTGSDTDSILVINNGVVKKIARSSLSDSINVHAPIKYDSTTKTLSLDTANMPGLRPYKVYTAIVNQSGTSAPTTTVLENTTGATFTWSYNSAGDYIATASSAILTSNKTTVTVQNGSTFSPMVLPVADWRSTTIAGIKVSQTSNDTKVDSKLASAFFEIRVYP